MTQKDGCFIIIIDYYKQVVVLIENEYMSEVFMPEIKKSGHGVDYAQAYVLKRKQRVYSSAMLMKIPHADAAKEDVVLKVGRYKIFSGIETDNPKSELTLDNEELNELIHYIESNYTPVSLGSGQYIAVQDDQAQTIRKFKAILENQPSVAQALFDNNILTDNLLLAATAIHKKRALEYFEQEIEQDYPESFWQDWFSQNKWVLGSDFAKIIDNRHIDAENIADYIMRAFDGFIDLVEIKKPNGLPFWATSKDHNNYVPSTDLIKAITQCLNYVYAIEQESNSAKFLARAKGKVIKPRCLLIYGRSNEWNEEQCEAFRILNASYHQISILTYDHLLERAKNLFAD